MDIETKLSLRLPLQLPIRVRILDDLPKLLAGGLPITPINLVLKQKQRERGATLGSLDTYVRAAHLYLESCAHRQQSLVGVSNEEFIWFKHALLGDPFPSASGPLVTLSGKRGRRTADLMLTLLLKKDDMFLCCSIPGYTMPSGTMSPVFVPSCSVRLRAKSCRRSIMLYFLLATVCANYGHSLSNQSVRAIVSTVRTTLDPPCSAVSICGYRIPSTTSTITWQPSGTR